MYTSEKSLDRPNRQSEALDKRSQHYHTALPAHGWKLASSLLPPPSLPAHFQSLVPSHAQHTLLCALSLHTIRTSYSIICTCRRLERDPSTFVHQPSDYRFRDPP